MLELKTKWFTNSLAKASMLNKDYVLCDNNVRLFIVGYGVLTTSGKNTYNYEIKDEQGAILDSGENAYLDKLTTLVKGENPKGRVRKEEKESKGSAKVNKNIVDEYLRLEANLKKAIIAFNDFQTLHNVTTFQDVQRLQDEQRSTRRKKAQDTRRDEINMLRRLQTLRKWAKDTKRIALLQSLSDLMLNL